MIRVIERVMQRTRGCEDYAYMASAELEARALDVDEGGLPRVLSGEPHLKLNVVLPSII